MAGGNVHLCVVLCIIVCVCSVYGWIYQGREFNTLLFFLVLNLETFSFSDSTSAQHPNFFHMTSESVLQVM